MIALGEDERSRLHDTFTALCRIPSPTGEERACADWVSGALRSIGLEVDEDGAGAVVGSTAGNLLARIPGRGDRSLLMCAHLDTVPLRARVEPVAVEDGWENAGDGILGADNKAAVAAIIELARALQTEADRGDPPEVGLELLFTVAEETGLHGAAAFDTSRLRSEFGYVFDHATPIGEIVVASPSHVKITADIRGRAAHAGLMPEAGASAIVAAAAAIREMTLGRLDADTTANVGTITGGTATNVVPERCRIEAEVRAIDQRRLDETVTALIDALQDGVDAAACDLDVAVERMFTGYRAKPSEPAIELAERSLRRIGYTPRHIATGGGADANAFRVAGFPCVNLANGTERAHEPSERVSFAALEDGLRLAHALVAEAGG